MSVVLGGGWGAGIIPSPSHVPVWDVSTVLFDIFHSESITYSTVYRKKAIKQTYYSVSQLKDSEHDRVAEITVDVRVIIRASWTWVHNEVHTATILTYMEV